MSAIGTILALIPCRSTSSWASLTEWSEEWRGGISTACTRSGPRASEAIVAVSAESIPPDRPRMTEPKPFLAT